MAPIAIAPRVTASRMPSPASRELLGVKRPVRNGVDTHVSATTITRGTKSSAPTPESIDAPVTEARPIRTQPTEFEKVVRRIPTLYVIAFFGVVVLCAVAIIWNTIQVNKLTQERTRLDDQITRAEQRLIRLRAEEMQLSAPSRVRAIAQDKLGMSEANGEDVVVIH